MASPPRTLPLSRLGDALARLPREVRDTLFTLAVIGWVLLPQTGNLPLWCSAMAYAVLGWRAWLALTGRPLPGRIWLLLLLGLTLAGTLMSFRTLLGREPGATLIVALLTLKTLELRARRDAFVVLFLCFFTMLTTFFFSQTLITAGLMLVGLLGLLTALVNAHLPAGRPPLRQALQVAARMLLLGAPVMAVLFVLFPRMGPLWGLPNDALAGQTGLSENMEVGRLSRLAQDNSIAMRVRFEGPPPSQSSLYFRGPVLSSFDGREWRPLVSEFPDPMRPAADLQVRGTPHRYEVTLEPGNGGNWLLLLDASPEGPRAANLRSRLTSELQWQASRPINTLLRYQAESYTDFRHGPQQAMPGLQDYVSLPPGFNPRTLALAASLMAEPALRDAGPERRLAAVMQRLREGGYRYTLEPGVSGTHSADEFWFDTKAGFCEHIASAFVVLMRALDVPARVVTGYQGGELNPVDDYLVVRRRDAHAWAEVWLPGRGWTRIDPTTAVAPARVLAPTRAEPAPGAIGAALANVDPAVRVTLRSLWEATNNRWNQWVLNYTQDRQMSLLRGLGFDAPTWQTLSYLLIAVGVLASLTGLAWNAWAARRRDPWMKLLEAAADRLRAWGATVPPNRSPRQLADLTDALTQVPDARRASLRDWLLRLEALRYAPSDASRPGLSDLARELRALPPRLLVLFAVILIADSSVNAVLAGQKHPQKKAVAAARTLAASGPSYGGRADARQAADEIAQRIGADSAWVRRVLAQAHYSPTVARLVLPPAVGTPKNWAAYRARFLDEPRIEAGAAFWRSHRAALERAERETGVPARLIVGVIGVETYYGRHTGNFRVLDALATLAFDFPASHPRALERSAFFRGELAQLLALSRKEKVSPAHWRGSYAGAMGLPQFMPSSWVRHAVDFDHDGHIDLFASPADAIGSVANYFKAYQWQRDLPTHFPVRFDADKLDLDALLAPDILPTFSLESFQAKGAVVEAPALQHTGRLALIELQNGADPPSYVAGTDNFYAITRYNWSSYYAMAVIELGDAVAQRVGR